MRKPQFSIRSLLLVTGLICIALVAIPFLRRVLHDREVNWLRRNLAKAEQRVDQIKPKNGQLDLTVDSAVQYLSEVQRRDALRKRLRELEEE